MLGVDYGEAKIGLAVSDPTGTIASPIGAIAATGPGDPQQVTNIAAEREASTIVVGLPLSLDGSHGPAARQVRAFCSRLRKLTDLPVVAWDERMTTLEAQSLLRSGGHSPTKARGAERGRVDSASAAIILNAYMQSLSHNQ